MLYWTFASTTMLDRYALLGWIRHSDVTSSLVISVLDEEDSLASKAKKLKDTIAEQVTKNKNTISKLNKSVKDLKEKNDNYKF